jgi:exportin-2 (importin alpha re-exporter)
MNSLVNVGEFFQANILPSLQADPNAEMPLLKADAIKFLYTFRGQLPKEFLLGVLPLLINHLKAKDFVVKTYAAICIERILFIRVDKKLM